jgi:Fe-S cluster biogenesis protein NfuA
MIMATNANEVTIYPEPTPNPASVRFVLDRRIMPSGTVDMPDSSQADKSPLAQRLFALPGVKGVLLGPDFVTVTATPETDWEELSEAVIPQIQEYIATGEPVYTGQTESSAAGKTDIEAGIIQVIEEEIRPAVAMDGGDIIFGGYENGIVHLHLRGSCSGCPSSLITLKMGIERLLKEKFPEIVAVEAL